MRALTLIVALCALPITAGANPVKQTPCKNVVVGRGLDRHVVCQVSGVITVKTESPKPKVIVVNTDGRNVVGRPRSDDRLAGLSHRLEH